ncbi:hypothetical protein PCL_10530 [Purpureocillium lilacinum]|uniref:Uncharacterized protein n=1 Tax=Purpureocillium lilacinum TaxID=33203 RepID=A0A2U3DQ33_PURLI|nr:hypothetical protein PCL_10530 [Purpureocillium lilacinum]
MPSRPALVVVTLLLASGAEGSAVAEANIACSSAHKPDYTRKGVRTYKNWCCLHFAIVGNHYNLVEFLVEQGILPKRNKQFLATALPLAAIRGATRIVRLLLDTGFDVSAELMGETALQLAAACGYTHVMAMLLAAGAPARLDVLAAAIRGGSLFAVTVLLENGANMEPESQKGTTALHMAVSRGNAPIVRLLMHYGARADVIDEETFTPLGIAIRQNQVGCVDALLAHDIVTRLLRHGTDIECAETEGLFAGQRPLHDAAASGNEAIVELLIAAGADKHARDVDEWTALHHAADRGHDGVVATLLNKGLNANARDAKAAMAAAMGSHAGSDPFDLDNHIPLTFADRARAAQLGNSSPVVDRPIGVSPASRRLAWTPSSPLLRLSNSAATEGAPPAYASYRPSLEPIREPVSIVEGANRAAKQYTSGIEHTFANRFATSFLDFWRQSLSILPPATHRKRTFRSRTTRRRRTGEELRVVRDPDPNRIIHMTGHHRNKTETKTIRVFQANVGKIPPAYDCALALADAEQYDVVLLQEPWREAKEGRCLTKSHPAYDKFSPVNSWANNSTRPRVMTYVRRRPSAQTEKAMPCPA